MSKQVKGEIMSKQIEFAKYINVTARAKSHPKEHIAKYYKNYQGVFICNDVQDVWIVCVTKDLNDDFDYQQGSLLVERDKIQYGSGEYQDDIPNMLTHQEMLGDFITDDIISDYLDFALMIHGNSGDIWDTCEYDSEFDCYEALADVYGIDDDVWLDTQRLASCNINEQVA